MTHIRQLLMLLNFIFLFSCINQQNEGRDISIFIINRPQSPPRHGVLSFLLEDGKIYINENFLVSGGNALLYRDLDVLEKRRIENILQVIDYSKSEIQVTGNKYGAEFSYSICLKYENSELNVDIFHDVIPEEYEPLIMYLEELKDAGDFITLNSQIEGVDDATIILPVNSTVSLSLKQTKEMFCLWKYLMCYSGVIDTISASNVDTYGIYDYSFSYGIDYIGRRLDRLILERNKILLIYNTGQVLKISNESGVGDSAS